MRKKNDVLARLVFTTLAYAALMIIASPPSAIGGEVDPKKPVSVRLNSNEIVRGWVTAYDEEGFDLIDQEDAEQRVVWEQLTAERVMRVYSRILGADDAAGWLDAAVVLYPRADGRREAEVALAKAIRIDSSLAEKADRVRRGEPLEDPPAEDSGEAEEDSGESEQVVPVGTPENHVSGPIDEGDVQAQFWGELSPELMAESVEELKAEAEQAQKNLRLRLRLYEDDNFLLYSDLSPAEANRWAGLLDGMYAKLLDMFNLPRGQNVFRGKCLIYVFEREEDYHRFCAISLGFNSQGSAGVHQSRPDGYCVVSFFRQADTLNFAHVLVHESVHAFVHRYRSYPYVKSWINEGLAELIAHELVSNKGFGESDWASQSASARTWLRRAGSMRNMMDMPHIDGWQYRVAHELTAFMLNQSKTRYRAFFHAIKDGKPWEKALEEDYGLTRYELVRAFGESIGINELRP